MKSLGSGHVDQRVSVLFDKNWPHAIWSNIGILASFKGTDDTEPIRKIGSVVGQIEVPIRNRLTYQGLLEVDTPFGDSDYSTLQQHGAALGIEQTAFWIGAGVSLARDDSKWNPGGYLRLEWRP